MKISCVKLYENGFMTQPFAFGGEEGVASFDASIKYRASLQNYVVDTGDEVILVDTGIPMDYKDPKKMTIHRFITVKESQVILNH